MQPALFEDGLNFLVVEPRRNSAFGALTRAFLLAEHFDGVLATVACHLAKIVE